MKPGGRNQHLLLNSPDLFSNFMLNSLGGNVPPGLTMFYKFSLCILSMPILQYNNAVASTVSNATTVMHNF
ncbi:hypothetical protein T10_5205 [Trichinella papuae]|uniref:Uncharacterized protein n=1 Tax=Trichinella papuae TaxID=268474 RepID=A0A0V1M3L3_9BILA|nr:hypothetical protein T10_5205 [Trichinella papuae]